MPARASGYGCAAPAALLAALMAVAPCAAAGAVTDAEALAIVRKHCVMCHAAKPTHPAFAQAPNKVTLESIADLKKHAAAIFTQTVQNKAMPLGNQTAMSEDERAALGHWLKALP